MPRMRLRHGPRHGGPGRMFRTARVTLARPLGTRVVLDVASGLPLVPGYQLP
jgi:hypothetical protein